ncbi:hypothetical protein D3C80_1586890 [compost metagenome]
MLVRIIRLTPRVAVIASSRTISICTKAITRKPSALASSAMAPGMNSFWKQLREAVTLSWPRRVSSFQALVICTAWETPMEKIRKGTRIDMGSSASPSSGNRPSSQITGTSAHTSAQAVSMREPEYQ